MAKKSYGNFQTNNQISEPQQNKEQISILQKIVKEIPFFAFIIFIVGIVWFVNHSPDEDKQTMTESTTQTDTSKYISSEATETDSTEEVIQDTIDENDPKQVGIIVCKDGYFVHHYSYNDKNDNWVNDDDVYDIFTITDVVGQYDEDGSSLHYEYDENGEWYSINASGYRGGVVPIMTCSVEKFEKAKREGFCLTHDGFDEAYKDSLVYIANNIDDCSHFTWCENENESAWVPDEYVSHFYEKKDWNDDYGELYTIEFTGDERDIRNTYQRIIPNTAVIAKSINHIMLSKNYNVNGFVYNDCHYSLNSDKWVNDETGEYLDSIPDEVLSRTKELYKQYGFDYKGYHHSYDEKSDKWICDDNSAVSYDYDSIPNDIDIVWLNESL